jgi:hypothetical protein
VRRGSCSGGRLLLASLAIDATAHGHVASATASYTAAKSIFDALGGGQVNGAYSLGGTFAVYDDTAPATTFGFFPDDQVSATITLDVDAYQIADFERAITTAAQADAAFWAKANAHLPITKPVTKLVDPREWASEPEAVTLVGDGRLCV